MRVLGLDTATLTASVALVDGERLLAEADGRADTHSEKLLPMVERVLAAAGLTPADLDGVACGAGPGSFTGLRIGLSTAKGLCFGLGRPLLMISSLRALADGGLATARAEGALVLALLDAKKHELYAGIYDGDGVPVAAEVVLPPARLPDWVAGRRVVVVGDGASAYPDVAAACGPLVAGARATPGAAALARLGAVRLGRGEVDDVLTAAPTYIRASEAEIATPPVDRFARKP